MMTRKKRGIRPRLRGLKTRVIRNVKKTSPFVVFRILGATLFFLPWLLYALVCSWIKMKHWRKVSVCKAFLERHATAFEKIKPETLRVKSLSGGVSNSNQIWECETRSGETVRFFAKIFVSAGSFWAHHLSLVSPFPAIYGQRSHERFTVDMISRVELAARNVAVPRLIAYDAVQKVMVTEFLEGENVDTVLGNIKEKDCLESHAEEMIASCGIGLATVHNAGFSLIDTQPVNCIWVENERKAYFTDLEFCTRDNKQVWDVGFFLCFLTIRLPDRFKKQMKERFLSAYQGERDLHLPGVADTADKLKEYLPIFQTILDIRQFTPEELFEELMNSDEPADVAD